MAAPGDGPAQGETGSMNKTFAAFLFLAALSPASAQMAPFEKSFDAALTEHGVIGGGFAFVHGKDPAIEHFFGLQKAGGGRKIDAETAYNWASITKTMTAIAIMQLRDRGLLSLDDPAVNYVPELRLVHDGFGKIDAVTIRQLLTHSAGFRNPTWPWDCDDAKDCSWQPFEPTKWSQVAAMLPFTHIIFAPGSRWSYSNPGYVFLGQIVERLSGDDIEIYIDKNILKPLEMHASYFDRAPYFLEPHLSASYLRAGAKLTVQPFDFDTGITAANSGLKAPIADMVNYLRFLVGDPGNPRFDAVLKRASLEEMWVGGLATGVPGRESDVYSGGPHGEAPRMGLGFFTLDTGGRAYVFHDGDQGGFSAELLVDPAGHSAGILAVNTTDTGPESGDDPLHAVSNTDPDPKTDLRQALRRILIETVFPSYARH